MLIFDLVELNFCFLSRLLTIKSQTRNVDLDIDFSRDELIMVSGENDESKEVLCSSEHWNRLATVHM